MKAVLLRKKEDLLWTDVPDPQIRDPHEVIVKMLAGGICGSDQHYYTEGGNGTAIVVRQPLVIGHEGCGVVEEVGAEVTRVKKGDMVVMRPARPCFSCYYCEHHMYTYCEHVQHLGSAALFPHTTGLFAEYVAVHEVQCGVVRNLKPAVGAFAEPLGIAYSGVNALGSIIGQDVVVIDIASAEESLRVSVDNAVLLGWGNGDPGFKEIERPLSGGVLTVHPFSGRAQVLIRSLEGAAGSTAVNIDSGRSTQKINIQYTQK